jgi:hypothetical protein
MIAPISCFIQPRLVVLSATVVFSLRSDGGRATLEWELELRKPRWGMEIGKPRRTYTVEPVEDPVPREAPEREQDPAPAEPLREPEKQPA